MASALSPDQQAQIERILADELFSHSQRCTAFLRFVAEQGQSPAREPLTERTIGIKVHGRPPDYDTEADPIVRVTASEVRKRLGQYYDNPAHAGELRVVVHRGSYLAEFLPPEMPLAQRSVVSTAEPVTLQLGPATALRRRARPGLLLAALLVLLAAAGFWLVRSRPSDLERFWAPVLGGQPRVLLCYERTTENWRILNGAEPVLGWTDRLTAEPDGEMPWATFARVFVDRGQIPALTRASEFLGSRGKRVSVVEASDLSMRDLRQTAAVILGGFNNRWTERLLPQARFYFSGEGTLRFVADRMHPASRQWNFDTRVTREKDFIIISRVWDPEAGRTALLAGGFSYWGTEAAVEFLTNPDHLQAALRQIPGGWEGRNLQLVLWCSVVQGASDFPKFLAAHAW